MQYSPENKRDKDQTNFATSRLTDWTDLYQEIIRLREENTRLRSLLEINGIAFNEIHSESIEIEVQKPSFSDSPSKQFTPDEKVTIFRNLFRGRADVYPVRWESSKGKSGYTPACGNEWKAGLCNKPQVKCGECKHRNLLPLTDKVIYDHLKGVHTVGIYPLLSDDTCYFLAADFDDESWREDALAFFQSCKEFEIQAGLEISRSGKGAHIWIFFSEAVPARQARQLGTIIISHTCARTRQLSLSSYDRLFPNQDTMPKGGFGNLIALPLQKQPRKRGFSIFVEQDFSPYKDQWAFLASIKPLTLLQLENIIKQEGKDKNPLDVAFISEDGGSEPWKKPTRESRKIPSILPEKIEMVLANQIYISKKDLPQPLANRLIRLAAFQNPEFYKAQAMRMPVWNKPRVICCAENFPEHIGLPRGCFDAITELLEDNKIQSEICDKRIKGSRISVKFKGKLRNDQNESLKIIQKHDVGVFYAPTGFGKTVIAAALIAKRKISTLILVHRKDLLKQWQERLITFLDFPNGTIGVIGGGKKKTAGGIDIAVMQSLPKDNDLTIFLEKYGQIIVDECHHISAFSFESILKQSNAKYVMGMTATPVRRDGHHPIIFMQCGPIRHKAILAESNLTNFEVRAQNLNAPDIPPDSEIQDIFRTLINDASRNQRIVKDIIEAYDEKRKILVLSERTEHLMQLRENFGGAVENCFVLHGRIPKKERDDIYNKLQQLSESEPRIIFATGRLIGEGFDYPPLDTLVLAMPISWKGTLQQYAGRLNREHIGKKDVRIYDYIENNNKQLVRMWNKRQQGYKAMGYKINVDQ